MIPARCDVSTVSRAERRVFDALADDPATEAWTVLHSLGLAARGAGKPYGEIDFVVLIPGGGVYCLEVKGGGVNCSNGVWTTTDARGRTEELRRSPFLQAREGMFALREAVRIKFGANHPAAAGPYGYAVVLPDVSAPPRTPEIEPWEVIDRVSFQSSLPASVGRLAQGQRARFGLSAAEATRPTAAVLRELRQFLRPDFDRVVLRSTELRLSEEKLVNLTSEQFDQLDLADNNPRCLFEGAAGTGKTALARELARRATVEGQNVLLICFNRLLGDCLHADEKAATTTSGKLVAGRFYQVLRKVIRRSSYRRELEASERSNDKALFGEVYPYLGRKALLACPDEKVQLLIVDEAQDLVSEPMLDVFDAWLEGGLAEGRWIFFGDFERQAIYSSRNGERTPEELRELMSLISPHHVRSRLKINCRNTRHIGEETALLSGYDSPPYRVGQVDGVAVDYHFYNRRDAQCELLITTISRLLADGIAASDIVVLSRFTLENSSFARLDAGKVFRLESASERAGWSPDRTTVVAFATAHAFKGMESAVVILSDVEDLDDQSGRALLYVAMSRARALLILFLDEKARPTFKAMFTKRLARV